MAKQKKKKRDKKTKSLSIRLLLPDEEMPEDDEIDEDERGVHLDKEDVEILYNALKHYKPTAQEEHLHSILLEEFDEILVVDFGKPFSDAN
jgi:hypothetical protein